MRIAPKIMSTLSHANHEEQHIGHAGSIPQPLEREFYETHFAILSHERTIFVCLKYQRNQWESLFFPATFKALSEESSRMLL